MSSKVNVQLTKTELMETKRSLMSSIGLLETQIQFYINIGDGDIATGFQLRVEALRSVYDSLESIEI